MPQQYPLYCATSRMLFLTAISIVCSRMLFRSLSNIHCTVLPAECSSSQQYPLYCSRMLFLSAISIVQCYQQNALPLDSSSVLSLILVFLLFREKDFEAGFFSLKNDPTPKKCQAYENMDPNFIHTNSSSSLVELVYGDPKSGVNNDGKQ